MKINQAGFGEYSIGNPNLGAKKEDLKQENNNLAEARSQSYRSANPDAVYSAMNIAGMHNKAQINIQNREINPHNYLSEERIADIEAMMAGFDAGVNKAAQVIEAEFPGVFTDAQKNSFAAKIYAEG